MHLKASKFFLATAPQVSGPGPVTVNLIPLWDSPDGPSGTALTYIKDSGLARIHSDGRIEHDGETVEYVNFYVDREPERIEAMVLRPDQIFESRYIQIFDRLY